MSGKLGMKRKLVLPRGPATRCPHCGVPIPSDEIAAVLAPVQRRLYEIIRDSGTVGISGRDILDKLYADDPDGGPESFNVVSATARNTNEKLAPFGVKLRANARGPWSFWYLAMIEKGADQ
jgi:hypothetical protein